MMSNNYETTLAFEKYEEIFWKKINKVFDLDNLGTNYKLKFFTNTPSLENMSECIDANGCLKSHQQLVSADDGFETITFGLVTNYPPIGGFELALNYTDDDEQQDLVIDAYEGVKGYYHNGRFYNDINHTSLLPYYNGHYHFDWTNYDPDDSDNDYGIVTYLCTNNSYSEEDKPVWIDYDGNIIVKGVFLVKSSNNFVMCYCRFSTPIMVRDTITIPKGSKFVQVGECSL